MLDVTNEGDREIWGNGIAEVTEADELRVELDEMSITLTLTPRQFRQLARTFERAAKRIERRQRGTK